MEDTLRCSRFEPGPRNRAQSWALIFLFVLTPECMQSSRESPPIRPIGKVPLDVLGGHRPRLVTNELSERLHGHKGACPVGSRDLQVVPWEHKYP